MATQSKYQNAQLEALLNDLLITLEKHKAPVDLSLMALGDAITNIIQHSVKPEQQQLVADTFAQALKKSLNTLH